MKKLSVLLVIILGSFILINFFSQKSKLLNPQKIDIGKYQNQKVITTDFKLETPDIQDKNLAQFYLWTQEDPLLTAPNFNAKPFSSAISALKNEEEAYNKLFNLKDSIFPHDFLNDLILISKLHNNFIQDPTASKAGELILEYKTAVKDYEKNINDLIEAIKKVAPPLQIREKHNFVVNDVNIATDIGTIENDINKIKLNAIALNKEIAKRQLCLEKGIGCLRPVNDYSDFKLKNKTYNFNRKDILSKKLLTPFSASFSGNWYGPYIVSTECLGWTDDLKQKPHLYFLATTNDNYEFEKTPVKLTELYAKEATTKYYRKPGIPELQFYGSNLKRISQSESSNYSCPSFEYKSKLSSVDFLYRNYKNKQIFTNLLKLSELTNEARQFFNDGKQLESKFFNSEFPSDTDADNLVNYYGLLYKQILFWAQKSDYKDLAWFENLFKQRKDLLNIYLEYKRGLAYTDQWISQAVSSISNMRVRFTLWQKHGSEIYTYTIRSYYGLLFFPFSRSVYREDKPLDYILKKKVDNVGYDKYFITYQEALKYYSKSEIDSWFPDQGKINTKLYREYLKTNPEN